MSYFLKLKEIPKGFQCIYIGKTNNLKRRMNEHNNQKPKYPCDFAIKKYGKIKEIEILEDQIFDDKELYKKEEYWISFYNSNDRKVGYNISGGGEGSNCKNLKEIKGTKFKFSDEEVLDIRKRRFNNERKKEVHEKYYNDRNWNTFDAIWKGSSRQHIGTQYITNYNPKKNNYYKGYNFTQKEIDKRKDRVKQIRIQYKNNKDENEILKNFPDFTKVQIRDILRKITWKEIEPLDYEYIEKRGINGLTVLEVKEMKELWNETKNIEIIYKKWNNLNKKVIKNILAERKWKDIKIKNYEPYDLSPHRITKEQKEDVLKLHKKDLINNKIHEIVGISVYSINSILDENNLTPNKKK